MVLSSLHLACLNGDIDQVKDCLNDDNINEIVQLFEENSMDNRWTLIQIKQSTPLICAIENHHFLLVKYLCEKGANLFLLE